QIGAGSYALFGKTAECKRRVDSKFSGQRHSLPNKLRHRFYVQSGACDMALYRRRYLPHVCRNGCSDTAGIEAEVIKLRLKTSIAQCCREQDIGGLHISADQFIDGDTDLGVE